MTTAIALTALAHLLALAGVLLLARHDHVLVDEAGVPVATSVWAEARVPAPAPVAVEADRRP